MKTDNDSIAQTLREAIQQAHKSSTKRLRDVGAYLCLAPSTLKAMKDDAEKQGLLHERLTGAMRRHKNLFDGLAIIPNMLLPPNAYALLDRDGMLIAFGSLAGGEGP
jgi:hypothetical protein